MHTPAEVVGVLLHFRTAHLTAAALDSLCREGVPRAILVDNSEDGGRSLAELAPTLRALATRGLLVDVLEPGRNLGFAAGVNAAFAQLRRGPARHALLINSDAVLRSGSLAAMCRCLAAHVIVVPAICRGAGAAPSSPFDYFEPLTGTIWHRRPRVPALAVASGCCMLVRADAQQLPFFDPDFFFYCEDVMLAHTLAASRQAPYACLEAVVEHAVSASARKGSPFYEYHTVRAHWLLAGKLARNRLQRAVFVALRGLILPARALLRALRQRSIAPLHALVLATVDVLGGRRRALTPPAD